MKRSSRLRTHQESAPTTSVFGQLQAMYRKLLSEFEIECEPEEKLFSNWPSLPDKALLVIKWRKVEGIPFWHWVVFCRQDGGEVVFDSKNGLKTNVRTDFARIKPKWFIKVLV